MALTVYGAMKLETLKNFRLAAGQLGLERRVSKIGILDYEFAGDMPADIENQFISGEFVLSSMLYAKRDEDILYAAVKRLIELKASALAIKTIFFKALPDKVRELADGEDFPVFLFDNDVYFEDIISEMAKSVLSADQLFQMEQRIDTLLHKSLSDEETRYISKEINRKFKSNIRVSYAEERSASVPQDLDKICNAYRNNPYVDEGSVVLKYRKGLMIFISDEGTHSKLFEDRLSDLLVYGGIEKSNWTIGSSNSCESQVGIAQAVKEAVWAHRTALIEGKTVMGFETVGLYQLLMPHEESVWLERYVAATMGLLESYDQHNGTDLSKTAVAWVKSGGHLKKASEILFVHENTVRYRINKIHKLLHPEKNELELYEQLAMGVRIYLMKSHYLT